MLDFNGVVLIYMEKAMSKKAEIEYLFNKTYCKVWYEGATEILYAKWSGFLSPDCVQEACSFMSRFIKTHGVKRHLSDHSDLKVLTREVQFFLTHKWFPELESLGLQKAATLISENMFARATVDKVNQEAQIHNLDICSFNSREDCLVWLNVLPS